ncbi:tetratricopeptide repeat protein [Paucibacter sp. APW11]|uniref:Tetratricopeptide repeat protein n=1 Tax=Roseateles aquae TaxID=3077235 RepID=A0ABU3PBT8_9BURK|nr:tetratricopeptide repeat protein [Paucibacter sp. APW11]MDT8999735.1 tetratricopeptide repeat protein [Paucibacter sp. APW11]
MTTTLKHLLAAAILGLAALGAQAGAKEDIQADMKAGRWSQADQRLDEVLAKHPENALAHYWRAQAKFHLGQVDEAQAEVRRARELDPSENFARDKTVLRHIMEAPSSQSQGKGVSTGLSSAPAISPAPAEPAVPAAPARPAPREPEPKKSGGGFWMFALLIGLGLLTWRLTRSRANGDQRAAREQWQGELQQASKDLGDAIAASDANPQLSQEAKLANYDRAKRAQGEISAHLSSLNSRKDFAETAALVLRSRDIAAEIRGEEKPSERAARMEMQRQAMQPVYVQQPGYGPGYGGPQPSGGLGVLGTVAAVGAGVAIGSMMSGSAEAHGHRRHEEDDGSNRGGYIPFDDDNRGGGLDLGGSDGGAAWDSGGGGDFDAGGGGSFD